MQIDKQPLLHLNHGILQSYASCCIIQRRIKGLEKASRSPILHNATLESITSRALLEAELELCIKKETPPFPAGFLDDIYIDTASAPGSEEFLIHIELIYFGSAQSLIEHFEIIDRAVIV